MGLHRENVEGSLGRAEKVLKGIVERREKLLKGGRDVISSSSKAIVYLHAGKLKEATHELENAGKLIAELRKEGKDDLSRYLIAPEAEFVEATMVNAVVGGREIPTIASLGVSSGAYVLGLLDGVGELKRLLIDSMMKGQVSAARGHFHLMEQLYSVLSPFAVYDNVINGVRRKIDLARVLVEDMRGMLAEEASREKLASRMEKLDKKLDERSA